MNQTQSTPPYPEGQPPQPPPGPGDKDKDTKKASGPVAQPIKLTKPLDARVVGQEAAEADEQHRKDVEEYNKQLEEWKAQQKAAAAAPGTSQPQDAPVLDPAIADALDFLWGVLHVPDKDTVKSMVARAMAFGAAVATAKSQAPPDRSRPQPKPTPQAYPPQAPPPPQPMA